MVPKLHAKGRSFRGAAAYLLHDKDRAKSAERVAWAETRNLATDDPDVAWRLMAATAMDQERLKKLAGVKNTGRKSQDAVLHLTLSWHPDEKDKLAKEEMVRAALGALRALKAEDRQALFVCHDDEPQPHLHILLNRVSAEDGRMLSSSKEKLALSRWAEAYEKERGKVLCEERVLNNAARDRGEYVRGEKDKPRHIYELEAANDNHPDPEQVRREQRKKDADAAKQSRDRQQRAEKAWRDLVAQHRQRVKDIRTKARLAIAERTKSVREAMRPNWKALHQQQASELKDFQEKEEHLIGRVQNALRSIDFKAMLRSGERKKAVTDAFQVIASAGARAEAVKRRQQEDAAKLQARQRAEEVKAATAIRRARADELAKNRTRFIQERSALTLSTGMDGAAVRATWKTRTHQRREAWEKRPVRAREEFRAVQPPAQQRQEPSQQHVQQPKAAPQPAAPPPPSAQADIDKQRARDEFLARMKQRDDERGRHRDRDRDR